jgi:hypothetical protein
MCQGDPAGTRIDQNLLRLFEPKRIELMEILQAVARGLQYDRPDTSAELFSLCGRHCFALEHLNCRLSRELSTLPKATSEARWQRTVDNIRSLSLRAQELKQGCAAPILPISGF